jgi:hypothetical protein
MYTVYISNILDIIVTSYSSSLSISISGGGGAGQQPGIGS